MFCILIVCVVWVAQTTVRPIRWPDVSKLEESVREQIENAQNSLLAVTKDPAKSKAELSEAYGNMGQLYHAYSLTAPARDCYLNAKALAPSDFRWPYLLAKLDQQEGRFDDAIRHYGQAQKLRSDYLAAYVNLGNVFLELNRLEDAKNNFDAALTLDQKNAAVHYGLGQIAMSRRNYREAVQHFETALAQTPGANRVHYSLAMAYRGLENTEKVKAHLAQQGTVGVRVSDPLVDGFQDLIAGERVYLSRGKLAFEAQRYVEAAAEFRKAVAAKPNSVTARVNLGAALTQLTDLDAAAEQFREAIRIEPEKANAHYNLAVILSRQNKPDEAITHLQSALKTEPNDLGARFLLAQQLAKSERVDEALAEVSRVVQADPNNEAAVLEQVKLLYRKKQFKQALDTLERAHVQYPRKGRTVVMLAYFLATSPALELRDGARALDLARRAYEATGSLQHGALITMALGELGRCKEAAAQQRQLVEAAERSGNKDLFARLSADLKRYEGAQSCRPVGPSVLTEP
ncbi:MAG TPA: tetratricopeptide repeat protein [Pyrinomonadaceae bacterium]|nr:tetratricopeptide repeat protein [Pyrinomonadaceae bacterium]